MNKEFDQELFEEQEEELFDALVDYLRQLPKAQLKVINPERYLLMFKTAAKLKCLLSQDVEAGSICIDVLEEFNMGSVSTELDSLTVLNTEVFADIVLPADNFEVYPLTNGNVRFTITFYSVLLSVA